MARNTNKQADVHTNLGLGQPAGGGLQLLLPLHGGHDGICIKVTLAGGHGCRFVASGLGAVEVILVLFVYCLSIFHFVIFSSLWFRIYIISLKFKLYFIHKKYGV